MKCACLLIASLTILSYGCATKKSNNYGKPTKLPMETGVRIQFVGIKDSNCVIGAVFVDAKTGVYRVICKP